MHMYVWICEYKWMPQCVYGGQRKTLGVSVSPTSLETGSPGCSKLCSQGLQASRDSPISVSRLLQKHKDCRHTLSCLAYMGRENSNSGRHKCAPTEPSPWLMYVVFHPDS